jgi:hypothetical protein
MIGEKIKGECNGASFIIDADLMYALEESRYPPPVFLTDFTSLELYYYDLDFINSSIERYCNRTAFLPSSNFRELEDILIKLFCIRLVNFKLQWGMSSPDLGKSLNYSNGQCVFDLEHYSSRLLMKNSRSGYLQTYTSQVNLYVEKMKVDPRKFIHGHDFVNTYVWYFKKRGVKTEMVNEMNFGKILSLACTHQRYTQFPLFTEILLRAK